MHLWHKWGLWERLRIDMVGSEPTYTVSGQRRRCLKCGLYQLKKL